MKKREFIKDFLLYGVFVGYIYLLLKMLFLSRGVGSHSMNLVPFLSISNYLAGGTENMSRLAFGNIIGNIVLFLPLGVYIMLFLRSKSIIIGELLVILLSAGVEVLQGVTSVGVMDVDDVILNSLGGFIGILFYRILFFLVKDEARTRSFVGALSSYTGIPVLLYFLFVMKMRF